MNEPSTVSPGFVGWVAAAFSSATGALLGLVWKKHNEEIKDIKTTMETNRREMRDAVIAVHTKIEANDRTAQDRHLELMKVLLERNH